MTQWAEWNKIMSWIFNQHNSTSQKLILRLNWILMLEKEIKFSISFIPVRFLLEAFGSSWSTNYVARCDDFPFFYSRRLTWSAFADCGNMPGKKMISDGNWQNVKDIQSADKFRTKK